MVARQQQEAQSWVRHTFEVRSDIQRVFTSLVSAESGLHRYILTGREEWLQPYSKVQRDLPNILASIITLVVDKPAQLERTRQLKPLIDQKLDAMARLRQQTPIFGNTSPGLPSCFLSQASSTFPSDQLLHELLMVGKLKTLLQNLDHAHVIIIQQRGRVKPYTRENH